MFSWETGNTVFTAPYTTCNNEGFCFLWLILGVNFMDLVRALSFVPSSGILLASVKP